MTDFSTQQRERLSEEMLLPDGSYPIESEDFAHYGVLGMRWGVRKAEKLRRKEVKLERKQQKFERRAARHTVKAEKRHNKFDLAGANRKGVRAARKERRAATYDRKARRLERAGKLEKAAKKKEIAEKKRYKAASLRTKADRISRTTGYGKLAELSARKVDWYKKKAAKQKYKMAHNERYIETVAKKVNKFSKKDKKRGQEFVNRMLDIQKAHYNKKGVRLNA